MKRTILCVSYDETVSASRQAALEEAGYTVLATTKTADALQMLSSVSFDLMVVGHRFSVADKYKLAAEARENGTPMVLICGATAETDIPADVRVYALEGTSGLVSLVAKLVPAMPAAAAARVA